MTNAEIARLFDEIAVLLEIQGEDAFRINTYRKVARTIDDLPVDVKDVFARGELESLPGIGKASAEKLKELLTTGRIALREELREKIPDSLLDLLNIPSLGPKKAALLWRQLGVTSIPELKTAIDNGKLVGLKGFGAKTIEHLRHGIEFLESTAGRIRIGKAWPLAMQLLDALRALPGVSRCEIAGSLRRGAETIGDLDLLCAATDGAKTIAAFTSLPGVVQTIAAGETKGSVLCNLGRQRVQVDLRVVPVGSFGAAWQYFTGNKQHNVRLRERAAKRGWTLNEYGLFDGERVIASETEADIYRALDLPCYPPELRENRFEFEMTSVPEDLLTLDHIRGDLHMHTTASDGRNTIEEMVAAAKARGYQIVCITDHSQSSIIANGLKPDRLLQHIDAVRAVARKTTGITVWAGAEVDILSEGRLDYDDSLLAKLDFVVASVHVGMSQDRDVNTQRTLRAIANPYVNLIGHPTGRLINRREAMPLDIETVAREAARTGTALEINASTYRLDLKDQHARLARDLGAKICIDTDAHSVEQLDQMPFGVITARRAGLLRDDVLNTRTPDVIHRFVEKKRTIAGK